MIRMRAVPDDFDNLQALHSPYGAVHGATTMLSPSDLASMNNPYGNNGTGPSMLDMRRAPGDSILSPAGLATSFEGVEPGQLGPMNVSDMASSASPLYQDRFAISASSASSSGLGFRTSGPYWHSGSSSIESSALSNRTGLRQGQPMHGRDWNWNPIRAPGLLCTPLAIYQGGTPASNPPDEISHSTASGPLNLEFRFGNRSPNAALASSHSRAKDRGDALPPLQCNTSPSQTNYSRGPVSAPLDMSTDRLLQFQYDIAPGENSFNRPFATPVPYQNASSESLKHLFGHGV